MILSAITDFSIFGIRILDVIDLLIVAYLFYIIYRLLKGTVAFNIFIGVVLFYAIGTAVSVLEMKLLGVVLGPFLVSGVLILIIIFQPEVRQFLLILGNNTLKGRSTFLDKLIGLNSEELNAVEEHHVEEILNALIYLSKHKTGALLIVSDNKTTPIWNNSGELIDAALSGKLLISLFHKDSPLHDGGVVITESRIFKSGVIFPITKRKNLPDGLGLRHRAGIGVSEETNCAAFIVSEETGKISYAHNGKYILNVDRNVLKARLSEHLQQKN